MAMKLSTNTTVSLQPTNAEAAASGTNTSSTFSFLDLQITQSNKAVLDVRNLTTRVLRRHYTYT
jgi:hypothetical protein